MGSVEARIERLERAAASSSTDGCQECAEKRKAGGYMLVYVNDWQDPPRPAPMPCAACGGEPPNMVRIVYTDSWRGSEGDGES